MSQSATPRFAPNFLLFYVDSPAISADFYRGLLQREPVECSPTFALFALDGGLMLGLWSRHTVAPAATGQTGAGELACPLDSAAAVDATHAALVAQGIPIAQAPTMLDFGYTCVGTDPDGHRLRVFHPTPEA